MAWQPLLWLCAVYALGGERTHSKWLRSCFTEANFLNATKAGGVSSFFFVKEKGPTLLMLRSASVFYHVVAVSDLAPLLLIVEHGGRKWSHSISMKTNTVGIVKELAQEYISSVRRAQLRFFCVTHVRSYPPAPMGLLSILCWHSCV